MSDDIWLSLICAKDKEFRLNNNDIKNLNITEFKNKYSRELSNDQAYNMYINNFCYQSISKLSHDFYKMIGFIDEYDNIKSVLLLVLINKKILKEYVKYGKCIPNRRFFFNIVCYHITFIDNGLDIIYKNTLENNRILNNVNKINKEKLKNLHEKVDILSFKLFEYQKNNVKWMLNIENNIFKGYQWNYINKKYIIIDDNFYVNTDTDQLILNNMKYNPNNNFQFLGGCLMDSSGLGKTICTILLCELNKPKQFIQEKNMDNTHLNSKATLIICKTHLCEQWYNEIKLVNKSAKIIIIIDKIDYNKIEYCKLIDTEYVIFSFEFLNSPNYGMKNIINLYKTRNNQTIYDILKTYSMENIKNPNILNLNNPILTLIFWYRIIFDDFHELSKNVDINAFKIINILKSSYKWCLTSSKLEYTKKTLISILNILNNKYEIKEDNLNNSILSDSKLCEDISKKIFRKNTRESIFCKNTRESICKEHFIFPIFKKKIFINFSIKEYLIYNFITLNVDDEDDIELKKFCTYYNPFDIRHIINNKTIREIKYIIENTNEEKILEIEKKLIEIKENLYKLNKSYQKLSNDNKYYKECEIVSEILIKQQHEYNEKKSLYFKRNTFFSNVFLKFDTLINNICNICLTHISEDNLGITICAHIYCYKCLHQSINLNRKCPSCRQILQLKDIYLIMEKETFNINTKLQYVINYINKEEKTEKFIIYTKWSNIIKKISNFFSQNGYENVIYEGITKKKNKILKKFINNEKIRIIFLTSNNVIFGLNLQKYVRQIIFLEPNYDNNDKIIKTKIIDCVNRLGLIKHIQIMELFYNDSIESKYIS